MESDKAIHIPVLIDEVIECLNPQPNENFIDGTLGEAGHAIEILERTGPGGRLLGIEFNPELLKKIETRIGNREYQRRMILECGNFTNLEEFAKKNGFTDVAGVLLDLGMSSWHLEASGRGFSFLRDESLSMRLDSDDEKLTAYKVINTWPETDLEKILRDYGEEKFSREIAREIIKTRKVKPILTTYQLAEVVKRAVPAWYLNSRIHFATKTFQALRITVNEELENLKSVLPGIVRILKPGGRMVIISFHSLEDRLVKNFIREEAKKGSLKVLTKKPIIASRNEISRNPRARSAKLRAALKPTKNE